MTAWTNETRQGYRTKAVQRGNIVVVIHRPMLSPEEAARQEEQIAAALAQIKTKE